MGACVCICTWVCTCSRMSAYMCAYAYKEAVLHPTPSSNASARGKVYWLGINPHASSIRHSQGASLTALPPVGRRPRPGPLPLLSSASLSLSLSLSRSLSLLTFAVFLAVHVISLENRAVRIGTFPCSSTRVTRHAHTGSSTGFSTGQKTTRKLQAYRRSWSKWVRDAGHTLTPSLPTPLCTTGAVRAGSRYNQAHTEGYHMTTV